jgi:hypothetical protein
MARKGKTRGGSGVVNSNMRTLFSCVRSVLGSD